MDRTMAECKKLTAQGPRWPASTFEKLRRNIATLCAQLVVLFGPKCDFFQKCFQLLEILEKDPVETNEHLFTPLLCRQIIWAILQDSRAFFSQIATPDSFAPGKTYKHPISLLDSIFDRVYYQEDIARPDFPRQWLPRSQPLPHLRGGGYGGNVPFVQ